VEDSRDHPRRPKSRFGRALFGALWLFLAGLSAVRYARELRTYLAAEDFVRRSGSGARWPVLEGLRLADAGDLSSGLAVDAALSDFSAAAPPAAAGSPGGLKEAGSFEPRVEESRAARALMLRAVEARPGSAYHRYLLGRAVFASSKGSGEEDSGRPKLWATPLHLAAAAAPGLDAVWTALGLAYLESWPRLSSDVRAKALPVLRRASLNEEFVSRSFAQEVAALGLDGATALLADDPRPLGAAADALLRAEALPGAAVLIARREEAERRERAADLKKIEELFRTGDASGLRSACLRWFSLHPPWDSDDPAGRAQAARVLEVWPEDPPGDWNADPRGDLVRFFLNGRESGVPSRILARAINSLFEVPEPARARVLLWTGNLRAAEELGGRPELIGALEWTPYFVALARYHLLEGRPAEARSAIERVTPGVREECDVLLARHQVARAQRDALELAALDQRREWLTEGLQPRAASLPGGTISICVDPEGAAARPLLVRLSATKPAIVAYGWDGGRSGTLLFEGERLLRVPLAGLSGRQSFAFRTLAGGPAHVLGVSRQGPS